MLIDAHFHVWQIARGDYGWLDAGANPALSPICRDVAISDWQAQAATFDITGGVLVQAAPTEAETQFLLEQAALNPGVRGVVGWVDWLAADVAERIEVLARQPKLKGLRPMLQDIADPAWVLQRALEPALRAMVACDLVFDSLVQPRHLPHLATLAARHPDLRIVIDHGGKPEIASAQWQPWAGDMERLATTTGVLCKLSGLLTEAGPNQATHAVRRYGHHLLACFGAPRLLWGSDWPVLELAASYGDWWTETANLLSGCSAGERAAVLGGNAARLYRLKDSP